MTSLTNSTSIGSSKPSRLIVNVTFVPFSPRINKTASLDDMPWRLSPSTAVIKSFGSRPAFSAGEFLKIGRASCRERGEASEETSGGQRRTKDDAGSEARRQ